MLPTYSPPSPVCCLHIKTTRTIYSSHTSPVCCQPTANVGNLKPCRPCMLPNCSPPKCNVCCQPYSSLLSLYCCQSTALLTLYVADLQFPHWPCMLPTYSTAKPTVSHAGHAQLHPSPVCCQPYSSLLALYVANLQPLLALHVADLQRPKTTSEQSVPYSTPRPVCCQPTACQTN